MTEQCELWNNIENPNFTDSHCHLDFAEFASDLPQLITQCAAARLKRIVLPAVAPSNWQRVLQLASDHSLTKQVSILPCLGIHPWFLSGLTEQDLLALTQLATKQQANLFAIGECGIDGAIAKQQDNLAQQIHFFDAQLALAKQLKLPVIVHHRQSHTQVLTSLKSAKLTNGGILHAFSGSYQQALQYIALGFKLGIGGTITYPRAKKTINAIKRLPLDALVLETDAPAMPLFGYQGQPNSPLRLRQIFHQLVTLRTESAQTIAEQLECNINQFIGQK
jgi:TatD DNase family protein